MSKAIYPPNRLIFDVLMAAFLIYLTSSAYWGILVAPDALATTVEIGSLVLAGVAYFMFATYLARIRILVIANTGQNIVSKAFSYVLHGIAASILIVTMYATIYFTGGLNYGGDCSRVDKEQAIYFSIVTFTTLGYGDFTPSEHSRVLAASEAFLGYLFAGVFIGGFIGLMLRERTESVAESCASEKEWESNPHGAESTTELKIVVQIPRRRSWDGRR